MYKTFILEKLEYKKKLFSGSTNQGKKRSEINKDKINKNMIKNYIILGLVIIVL